MTEHSSITTPKRRRCVIHIGTEKTDTSSIQQFLSINRAAFAREGVVYPEATGANGGSQWGLVIAASPTAWRSDLGPRLDLHSLDEAKRYRERLITSIDREIARAPGAHTLVVSSEHFHSRLRTVETIAALKTFLARWASNFEVIVYFRRQDRTAISLYSTKLKSGNPSPHVFPPDTRRKLAPSRLVWNDSFDDVNLAACKNNFSPRLWG